MECRHPTTATLHEENLMESQSVEQGRESVGCGKTADFDIISQLRTGQGGLVIARCSHSLICVNKNNLKPEILPHGTI